MAVVRRSRALGRQARGRGRLKGAELELAEAAAYESLQAQAGFPVRRVAGARCTALPAAPDDTMLNRVTGLGLAAPVDDAALDEIAAFFLPLGVRYAVAVSPLADDGLRARLLDRGFEDGYGWMKFGRGVAEPADPGTRLRVERVDDGADFGRVVAAAYGFPESLAATVFGRLPRTEGWHCFVAYDGSDPAGAGALFVHGAVGWLGAAGTAPEHRRKGAQNALLAARIRHARALGLEALATETGERLPDRPSGSYRNILRAGFEELYVRPNLLAPR